MKVKHQRLYTQTQLYAKFQPFFYKSEDNNGKSFKEKRYKAKNTTVIRGAKKGGPRGAMATL